MDRKEGRKEGLRVGGAANKPSRGFTAAETVVTVVVLAILSAYAIPKLFGLQDQAKSTEETLKIKDIEARHTQELLKAGKRGVNPALGDVVGFRPEVVAEPAPDTAPMRVSYSYSFGFWLPGSSMASTLILSTGHPRPTNAADQVWQDRNGDGISSCSEIGDLDPLKKKHYKNAGFEIDYFGEERGIRTSVSGGDTDRLLTDPIPSCVFERYEVRRWYSSSTSATGLMYLALGPEYPLQSRFYVSASPQAYSYGRNSNGSWYSSFNPNRMLYDCRYYSRQYGVPYVIKGASIAAINGGEAITASQAATYPSLFQITGTSISEGTVEIDGTFPTLYRFEPNPINMANHQNVVCERQGPAPVPPPADPGDPGAYSMAADHSGYCLSPGRKLPTYRDSAGTPTSSASDPVVELASEAVDDSTNCL
jgi:prepilin-type N-terminal cleavage/methylation domain-containing protein